MLMDPPTVQWPVFPTFDQRTLATLVEDELGGTNAIEGHCGEYARDFLLALDEDIHPPSITTDGVRSILQRHSDAADIDIEHPKHVILLPTVADGEWEKSLSAGSDTRLLLDISITWRRGFVSATRTSKPTN